ncbi:MAG: hypothetical protein EOP53_20415 [Sphingobacteriales bacterium]|nr:MAG: hypothetical protein EOP53_20415 [Sphingobacteriales bacterium]
MKKILLTSLVVAMGFFAAEAQTKKKSKKAKQPTAEQKQKAALAKLENDRQAKFETMRLERLEADSMRLADESKEEFVKDSLRQDWKAKRLAEVDSTNKVNWTKTVGDKEAWYDHERSQNAILKSAGVADVQGRKVKAINEQYNDRAKAVKLDSTLSQEQVTTQLASINDERRAKIKEVVGSSKERKLEKARKSYSKKNNDDHDAKWINDAAMVKKEK